MTPITLNAKVGPDGTLSITLPPDAAGQEVRVTIHPTTASAPLTQEEWRLWVSGMAGSWQGDFERMPQGEYEDREPLS